MHPSCHSSSADPGVKVKGDNNGFLCFWFEANVTDFLVARGCRLPPLRSTVRQA
jgi:hypothetical protein